MSILAGKKKPSSIYEDDKEQKNPFEGKKVVFIEDENDKENGDGVKGHLEAIGDSEYNAGIYEKYVKRAIDVVLSFGGLIVFSPIFLTIAIAIRLTTQDQCCLPKSVWDEIKNISNYISLEQ